MKNIIITLSLLFMGVQLTAQETEFWFPSLSPKGIVSQEVGNTHIIVEYERPSARNRQIFGALVPWKKVWRTGAGYCTKISFNKNVKVGGQKIPAGKYALFTIPSPEEWMIIINKDTTLYGSYDYDYKKDVARFTVIPTNTKRFYETLNIDIELIKHNAKMYIAWTNTQISFDIETTTNDSLNRKINEELLTKQNKEAHNYSAAASYLFWQGEDFTNALLLADKAIELDADLAWPRYLKADIYEKLQLYDKVLEEFDKTMQLLKKIKDDRKNEIIKLESEYQRIKKLLESTK